MTTPAPFLAHLAEAPEGALAFWLTTDDGKRVRAAVWPGGGRGTAVIFAGRSEYIEKYGRVVGRLALRGFTVVAFDWRGQGLSTRPANFPQHGHVDDFREYQRDWAAVLAHAEAVGLPRPFVMIGHSMGGCIGLRTLIEGSAFAGAILSAPMWRLQMRAATRQITSSLAVMANRVGLATRRMPGTNRLPSALAYAFQNNALTSCDEHFAWFGRQLTAEPGLGLAGPSVQWTYAALEEMARLYRSPEPLVPVMSFLGSEEVVVSPTVIRTQMAKMPQGKLVGIEGARHEIWMERPEIQARVWAEVDAFLPRLAPRRTPARIDRFGHGRTAAPMDKSVVNT
jgi:lysophospholipase